MRCTFSNSLHKCDIVAFMQPSNPFTPTFGYAPHVLIGRDGLLAASAHAIEVGPDASRYTTVYTGPRGSGKTVLLNEIENQAAQQGWVVVSVDAGSAGVGERISEMIDWARSVSDNPDADEQATGEQTTTVKGIRVGPFYAHRETLRRMQPRWGLRRQLTELAAAADEHEAGVLLSVDEMHRCDSESLLRLANDLQHVSKRQRLPLAFAGASLPEIKHTYLEDDRFSFFRRCGSVDLPTLDGADATRFITESVKAGGGACTLEAVRMLADACGGLPYHLQLLGDHAWRIAGAPAGEITGHAATESILLNEKVMQERVYHPTFNSLTDAERRYLKMLHDLGGTATRRMLGAKQTLTAAQMATTEQWLLNNGCIQILNADENPSGGDTEIGFGFSVSAETVATQTAIESGCFRLPLTLLTQSPTTRNVRRRCRRRPHRRPLRFGRCCNSTKWMSKRLVSQTNKKASTTQ